MDLSQIRNMTASEYGAAYAEGLRQKNAFHELDANPPRFLIHNYLEAKVWSLGQCHIKVLTDDGEGTHLNGDECRKLARWLLEKFPEEQSDDA